MDALRYTVMKNSILILLLFFALTPVQADDNYFESSYYIGGSTDSLQSNDNWTAEMGFHTFFSRYFLVQGSLMYFEQSDDFYGGGNLSFSITNGQPISLYTGIGAFTGTHEECREVSSGEICSDTFTGGVYPEAGIILTAAGAHIGVFARRYKTFESGNNNFTMYGLKLGASYY